MEARGEKPEGVRLVMSKPVTMDDLKHAIAEATAGV
jgi:hypothetical protein